MGAENKLLLYLDDKLNGMTNKTSANVFKETIKKGKCPPPKDKNKKETRFCWY